MTLPLQRSALHSLGGAAGSGFQERYGWELPAAYTDAASEYQAATTDVAVYDASYMGRLKATGTDALDLLNRLSTNKVDELRPGQGAPTILTTDRGRILDVITVLNATGHVLLLTSPGMQQPVIQWLDKYTILEDLAVEDISSSTAMLAILGPESQAFLERATGAGLAGLPLYHTVTAELGDCRVRVVSSPFSELPSYYLIAPADAALMVWRRMVEAGGRPIGTEAYEAARIRFGVPVHGRETGEDYNPLEAGLTGSIDFAKGCYIGQEVIARLDAYQKVQKYLAKLEFGPDAAASAGAHLLNDGQRVGRVTSVATLPSTGETFGLAYVRARNAVVGARLELEPPGSGWAEVRELPQLFGPGRE